MNSVLLKRDVDRMSQLGERWGGDARTILNYVHRPDSEAEKEYRTTAPLAVRECGTALAQGPLCNLPDSFSSSFYFVRPYRTSRDLDPAVVVPTRTLCCYLAETLLQHTTDIKEKFFDGLFSNLGTKETAACIYESWLHSFFTTQHKKTTCHWIAAGQLGDEIHTLQSTTTVVPDSDAKSSPWTLPCYLPFVSGITSAFILENAVVVIRSINFPRCHDVGYWQLREGMAKLHELLPDHLKTLPWMLLFVGTEAKLLRMGIDECAGQTRISFPTGESRTNVCVGWAVVRPVQHGVHYKAGLSCTNPHRSSVDFGFCSLNSWTGTVKSMQTRPWTRTLTQCCREGDTVGVLRRGS